jgi:hypothetical protein
MTTNNTLDIVNASQWMKRLFPRTDFCHELPLFNFPLGDDFMGLLNVHAVKMLFISFIENILSTIHIVCGIFFHELDCFEHFLGQI